MVGEMSKGSACRVSHPPVPVPIISRAMNVRTREGYHRCMRNRP